MIKTKTFTNIADVDSYVIDKIQSLHSNSQTFFFLGGSFARKSETKLSDIDYTACINDKIEHPRFYFEIINVGSVIRLLSIYFYSYDEVLIDNSKVDDEVYLWMKLFLPKTRFVGGDKSKYDEIYKFYSELSYTRKPKAKTVHKSFGKLLELIARIKKWYGQDNFVEMVYYGTKLAEHVRRLVIEVNGPIALESENKYLQGHFDLPLLPKDFEKLYIQLNRYTQKEIDPKVYRDYCITLVKNTAKFLLENKQAVDDWTLQLLSNESFEQYVDLCTD